MILSYFNILALCTHKCDSLAIKYVEDNSFRISRVPGKCGIKELRELLSIKSNVDLKATYLYFLNYDFGLMAAICIFGPIIEI